MNSLGLGILTEALRRMHDAGGDLRLGNVTDRIQLLIITKLLTVFQTFKTVEKAVESYQ